MKTSDVEIIPVNHSYVSKTAMGIVRILILSSDKYPPFRVDVKDLFGIELCKRNYQVDWVLQSDEEIIKPVIDKLYCGQVWVGKTNNGEKWYHRLHKHVLGFAGDLRLLKVDLSRYDAVQVKDKFIAALIAIIAVRRKSTKFIYWLSYPFPEASLYSAKIGAARYPLYYRLRGHIQRYLLYKIILQSADHIFVQSDQMKKDIEEEGIAGERMTPVPMGISDINFLCILDKPNDYSPTAKVILYLGTLIRDRKMDFIVRVFKKVKHIIPDVQLQLVGGGEDNADIEFIKKEISNCGLESRDILITGFLPLQEAWNYVRYSDVCVSPYYPTPILNSTSPTKLIEYMAFGKPVVGNDHPEQRKVIEDSGGGICVPYNEDSFASAIIELLHNPEKAKEMGKKGRVYVEKNRTYSKLADIVDEKYRQLLD